ncbi:MAG: hypothetical protein WBP72_08775 [Rhodocyclaceae bacterium]
MYGLIRRNRRPTLLRRLVSAAQKDLPPAVAAEPTTLPSHHIFCAGTYTPVFARLAAETALAACPTELRPDFRLFIHVDGVASDQRADLLAWLREIPGAEVTYGLFGILSHDRIPGKWHQVMINDVVRQFRQEAHLAFIDADLFIDGRAWWDVGRETLAPDVYSISAGIRGNRHLDIDGRTFFPIKTNLFTLNTGLHLSLNEQRFNKDARALRRLGREFPAAALVAPNVDTLIAGSLRAQAHGLRVIDVDDRVDYCHVGGFSHLRINKFHGFDAPQNRATIEAWISRLRLLSRVLDLFLTRGWERFIDRDYRKNIAEARTFVAATPLLQELTETVEPTRHERVFERLFAAEAGGS